LLLYHPGIRVDWTKRSNGVQMLAASEIRASRRDDKKECS
jgi:hypothetical protein